MNSNFKVDIHPVLFLLYIQRGHGLNLLFIWVIKWFSWPPATTAPFPPHGRPQTNTHRVAACLMSAGRTHFPLLIPVFFRWNHCFVFPAVLFVHTPYERVAWLGTEAPATVKAADLPVMTAALSPQSSNPAIPPPLSHCSCHDWHSVLMIVLSVTVGIFNALHLPVLAMRSRCPVPKGFFVIFVLLKSNLQAEAISKTALHLQVALKDYQRW